MAEYENREETRQALDYSLLNLSKIWANLGKKNLLLAEMNLKMIWKIEALYFWNFKSLGVRKNHVYFIATCAAAPT